MSVIRPRRTKIGRDPNNTAWARDEASFGQRFMRQQGWQPGDVLGDPTSGHVGMHSQASTSHIRVSLKDDSNGLGWKPGGPDGDDALTGMDVLKDIFGRLNGKGGEEGRREQERKKGLMYIGHRGGGIAFVRGGLLVGDKMEGEEDNDGRESDKSAKTDAGVLQSQLKRKRDANSESSDSDNDNESESGSDSSTNSEDERQARKRLKAENKEKKAAKKQRKAAKKAARKAAKAGRSASIPTAPSASDSGSESHSQPDSGLGSGSDAPGAARETITHTSKTSDSTAGSDKAARKEKKRLKKEKKAKKEAKRLEKEKKKQEGVKKAKKDSTKDAERQQRVVVRSRLSTHKKAPLDSDAMKRLFMVG